MLSVISLLSAPNFSSPANVNASVEWRKDPTAYKKRIQLLIEKAKKNLPPNLVIPHPDTNPAEREKELEKMRKEMKQEMDQDFNDELMFDDEINQDDEEDFEEEEIEEENDEADEVKLILNKKRVSNSLSFFFFPNKSRTNRKINLPNNLQNKRKARKKTNNQNKIRRKIQNKKILLLQKNQQKIKNARIHRSRRLPKRNLQKN